MILFHGSPCLFDRFDLSSVGEGSGVKYGFGVYLTQAEKTAVHYSQPRKQPLTPDHYLYTVEIDDLVEGNHIVSANPVPKCIIDRAEGKLGSVVPGGTVPTSPRAATSCSTNWASATSSKSPLKNEPKSHHG